jgi:hypothetical protein
MRLSDLNCAVEAKRAMFLVRYKGNEFRIHDAVKEMEGFAVKGLARVTVGV